MRDPSTDSRETLPRESSGERSGRSGSGVNRRDFLRGTGAAVAATAMVSQVQETIAQEKKKDEAVAPAAPVEVKLNINGKEHTLQLEPRVTLQEALHHDLQLTGCKDVCGAATNCGACTVIVDGKPIYSCATLAIETVGKKVTTVEGVAAMEGVSQVINAFVKHDATQCGYCTPGFVVAVKAFVDKNPGANLEQILKGLGGNLCRCGTYAGVEQAAVECCKGGK